MSKLEDAEFYVSFALQNARREARAWIGIVDQKVKLK